MRLSRAYLWLIAASMIVGLALLLNDQVTPMIYVPNGLALVGVCGMTMVYAIVGLGCAAAYENGKAPRLLRSGMIIGLIALVGWGMLVLSPGLHGTMGPLRALMCITLWPCLMMLCGLLLLLPMHRGWRWWLRAIAIAMVTALALFIAGAYALCPDVPNLAWNSDAWQRAMDYEERATEIGAGIAMLTGGAVAATVIIGLVGAMTGLSAPEQPMMRRRYWLQCPRCGREQDALTGDHHCIACSLRTRIDVV